MIVSHKHKLIFLKPKKVAGTSFEVALSKYLGKEDIITPILPGDELTRKNLGFIGCQNYEYTLGEFLASASKRELLKVFYRRKPLHKFFNHISAKQCRERIGDEIWNEYHKVSIVRNPWDMALSMYYWFNGRDADLGNLTNWFSKHKEYIGINNAQYMIDNNTVVDTFVRYEKLEEDILSLEKEMPKLSGLYNTFKKINTKGNIRPKNTTDFHSIYQHHPKVNELIEMLGEFEIKKFGYSLSGIKHTDFRAP